MLSRHCLKGGRAAMRHFTTTRPALANILCSDSIDPVCIEIFKERGHQVDYKVGLPKDELIKIIPYYDGLVVRSATKVTKDVIQAASKLKVIGRAGVGVDNIDLKEATRNGVMVMNTPGGNTVSTAQLAFSLLTSAARSLPRADMSMKADKWERSKFMGSELKGKTLAIVGCGRIGQTISKWAKAFDMVVVGFDPSLPPSVFKELGIKQLELEQVWPVADFITLHTPLTPDTANLINTANLNKCKKGVHIINCARGGIINEEDLLEALNSGQVGAAAVDVYEKEPPGEKSKALIAHPNVVCTPHLGASTEEAQVNVARDIAVQMCDTLEGKDYVGVVNVDYMALSQVSEIKPFAELATFMGQIISQFPNGKIKTITTSTWGGKDISITSSAARKLLQANVLKGVLKSDGVSAGIVSAPFMIKEKGLEFNISEKAPSLAQVESPYQNLIVVEVTTDNGTKNVIAGSVFGAEPTIVAFDTYKSFPALKLEKETSLLAFRNKDEPGGVSGVLDVLEEHNVNIGNLTLGRQEAQLALCLLTCDGDIPAGALEKLMNCPNLKDVRKARLA